jgi:hypothetical protein
VIVALLEYVVVAEGEEDTLTIADDDGEAEYDTREV